MLLATVAYTADSDEEECIYDQDEQRQAYLELQKTYPGSQYIEDEYKLHIPDGGDQIMLRRGGCVHFGVAIEFRTSRTTRFDDESVFFSKIMDLVVKYGQGLIDQQKLEASIRSENWHSTNQNGDVYYFLTYPDVAAFEIFGRHDQEHTTIGISFYQ